MKYISYRDREGHASDGVLRGDDEVMDPQGIRMASGNPYALVVRISARKGLGDQFEALMYRLLENLATEDCFVSFNFHRDPTDRDQFMFYELWTDEARYMAVRGRAYFQTYLKDRVPLIEDKVERMTSSLELVVSRSGDSHADSN